ncbi:MAG: electron transport complex subunit RsxG [Rhodocyclaceae bacterium]|nr:electron transport complex subunit RsxG [Rhodocyclaceae bacterium]
MSRENLSPPPAPNVVRISTSTALVLLLFTLAFTALMAVTYQFTKTTIAANALAAKMELIGTVLPPSSYDNDLLADAIDLPPTAALGTDAPSRVYRARKDGAPAALVLEAAAPDGYSGRIDLLIAVKADGRIAAVRVTGHHETPGLGDYIDPKKDKNKAKPWITQFDNLGFGEVKPEEWHVKKDGGHFDAHAGATISARAVTNAVGRALQFAVDNRDRLFEAKE